MVIHGNKEVGANPPPKKKSLCAPEEDCYKQMKKLYKGFAGELLLLFTFTIEKI